jgi:ketosteroid isomerase-like protein
MKKMFFSFFTMAVFFMACNNNPGTTAGSSTSSITLPYTAGYSTDFNNNVSDSDLLLVLNSYKYWENADYKALRGTMGDSMVVESSEGFKFNGRADSLMKTWQTFRDSLSTVVIKMEVWLKNHSLKDSSNYINVWYKEIDTYKSGRVDSMNFADVNMVKNGKIVWYSQFKQKLK